MRVAFISSLLSIAVLVSASTALAETTMRGAPKSPPPVHPTSTGRGGERLSPIRVFLGQGPNNETTRRANGFTNRTVSWTHGIGWVSSKPGRDGNFKVRGLVRTGWYSETSGGKGGKVLQETTGSTTTIGSRTRSFWTTKDKATGEQRSFRSSAPKSNKH